jgi:hypothetical protein
MIFLWTHPELRVVPGCQPHNSDDNNAIMIVSVPLGEIKRPVGIPHALSSIHIAPIWKNHPKRRGNSLFGALILLPTPSQLPKKKASKPLLGPALSRTKKPPPPYPLPIAHCPASSLR